jgi:hypothetical protein
LLDGVVPVPPQAGECLGPLRWLLEHIGEGTTLTQAGWLPRAMVREASHRFGWFELIGFTVRTETDLPELFTLHELARRARLITKRGRKISVSASGRRALGDPILLWRVVVADLFSVQTYQGEGAALAAATLLSAGRAVSRRSVEATVGAGLEGRWHTDSGGALDQCSGMDATRDFGVLADVFGWLEEDDDWQNRTWTLTSTGRLAALLGLQIQAQSPRHRS